MSAIVLDHAREVIAAEERNSGKAIAHSEPKGRLQGRKIVPLSFYLLVGGTIVGGVAALALTISALALSLFLLYAAVAAAVVLCLTNAIGAFSIHYLTPAKDLDLIISKLTAHKEEFLKSKQNSNINSEFVKDKIKKDGHFISTEHENKILSDLQNQQKRHKALLAKFDLDFAEFMKRQESDKLVLEKKLEKVIKLFEQNEIDTRELVEVKKVLSKLNIDEKLDFDTGEAFTKLIEINRELYNQFFILSSLLEEVISELNQSTLDKGQLEKKVQDLQTSQIEMKRSLREKELEIDELKLQQERINDLVKSKIE